MFLFPKARRLLKRSEFQLVRAHCDEIVGKYVRIRMLPSPAAKLGLIVTRKFGKATYRNRFKRMIREIFRTTCLNWPSFHLVVLPRQAAKEASYTDIATDLNLLIANHLSRLSTNVL